MDKRLSAAHHHRIALLSILDFLAAALAAAVAWVAS